MRYIKIIIEKYYTGREEMDLVIEDNLTDNEIDKLAESIAENLEDRYRDLAIDSIYREDYETEEDYEEAISQAEDEYYNQDIYYSWEEISKEDIEKIKIWTKFRKVKV